MPGLNGMGPVGAGPRTGRAMGRCVEGQNVVGVGPFRGGRRGCGFGFGRGAGMGRGFARGAGMGRGFSAAYSLDEYENYLENELRTVKNMNKKNEE